MAEWWDLLVTLLDPALFAVLAAGTALGVAVGCVPGLAAPVGVGLLLPFSFYLSPVLGLGLLIGIYKGAMFGGAISAVLIGVPGTPDAAVDVLDGHPMTKKGRPRKAINTALFSSFIGDLIASIVLLLLFLPLVRLSLSFDSRGMVGLSIFALCIAIGFAGKNVSKAVAAAAIGVLIASIGTDPMSGTSRLTFGLPELQAGVGLLPFIIGVFALPELLIQFENSLNRPVDSQKEQRQVVRSGRDPADRLSWRELGGAYKVLGIGSLTGIVIGAIPGPGATVAAFTSYGIGSRISKQRFGSGSVDGLAAAESASSATVGGALMPLFAFGIPGSATAALFAGAFLLHGITPGPSILQRDPDLIYSILLMILLASFINLFISKLLIPVFVRVSFIPVRILLPILFALIMLSIYAYENRLFDVIILLFSGLLGYLLVRYKFPLMPLLLSFMLLPLFEENFRRVLALSRGEISYFFGNPLAVALVALGILLAWLFIRNPIESNFFTDAESERP